MHIPSLIVILEIHYYAQISQFTLLATTISVSERKLDTVHLDLKAADKNVYQLPRQTLSDKTISKG